MPDVRIFDRLAPFVREFVYEHDWESLRAIQVAAADAILNTDANVLLTSATASGKTEAAFFPILTQLWERPSPTVGCLYVGPLKALINDQFYRLMDLCEQGGVPVWHWHGDVSSSHKARLMKHPSGILQITPESLEALLLRRHAAIPSLFGDLRFVVIDEVHSLLRGDRGAQTLCLLERLSRLARVSPRRVGLSATIGDAEATARILGAGTGRPTVVPQVREAGQTWRLSMEHFYTSGPQAASQAPILREPAPPAPDVDGPPAPALADPGLAYVFEHTRGRKCLVFANSREECEAVTSTLRSYCEANGEPDRFLIHHGNLSSSLRQSAEELMRADDLSLTTCTTSTLELGIDIGRLERAFQMDAPFTVSAFLQRMGRTGRRGQPPEMWFVMREDQSEPRSLLPERLPWKLLQGIALVQLYLEERWVEPPRERRRFYSLLYHQTMATLAADGEQTPASLAARVLSLSPFAKVSLDDYRVLLRHLVSTDQIERTETGGLIVGLAGERVVNDFRFYGVFVESEEYAVRSESQELGTVVQPPPAGEKLALAGRVWIVEEVDHKKRLVYVTEVKGKVPAYFGECPGDIHTHVLERMREVLREPRDYAYLRDNARSRLGAARLEAREGGVAEHPLVNLGGDTWALFPWLGTYAFLALERLLKLRMPASLGIKGVDACRPYYLQFRMAAGKDELVGALQEVFSATIDPACLLFPGELPVFDKYDEHLPPKLVRKGFAEGVLDVNGARERVLGW
ncbi:DEAD/DEAH box helicase [Olsenella massiliensis]|uniref:DEAD/DEAH box helicase n=1 Tax=Olsenella massiliensis TaxID=1622075 RepID=UPI00071C592F|nr:DEAD/DEAH box helicase [Olsenella massiliensis]